MYQKIIIVGNLGGDPELRYFDDGSAVCNFNVATSRKWREQNGNNREETTWFRVTTSGKTAEACKQYLSKGSKVLVEGRLKPDPQTGSPKIWQKGDGSSGASFEIATSDVKFLSSRNEDDAPPANSAHTPAPSVAEDEIPF